MLWIFVILFHIKSVKSKRLCTCLKKAISCGETWSHKPLEGKTYHFNVNNVLQRVKMYSIFFILSQSGGFKKHTKKFARRSFKNP